MNDSIEFNEKIHVAVKKYSSSIIRVALAYSKNIADAEDIAQDTFLAYYRKRPIFQNEEHEKAWLIRVTINKSKNLLKTSWIKNKRKLTDDLSYMAKEESNVIHAVLALDKKYRIPIHLYYYEGYSINEIEEIIGTKASTVATRLDRGRKILKEKLGGMDFE